MVGPTATRSTPSCSSIDQRSRDRAVDLAGGGVRRGGAVEVEAVEVGGAVVGRPSAARSAGRPSSRPASRSGRPSWPGRGGRPTRRPSRSAWSPRWCRWSPGRARRSRPPRPCRARRRRRGSRRRRTRRAARRSVPSASVVVTCGSQSSTVLDRTTPWLLLQRRALAAEAGPAATKSRSGRPVETTRRTTSPCWRAVTSAESYADSRTTVGALGSATSTTSTRGARRDPARCGVRGPGRSPRRGRRRAAARGRTCASRGSDPTSTGSAPVTS